MIQRYTTCCPGSMCTKDDGGYTLFSDHEQAMKEAATLDKLRLQNIDDLLQQMKEKESKILQYQQDHIGLLNEIERRGKQIAALQDEINNPKRTYCAWCGFTVEIDDEGASNIAKHVDTCKKHPLNIKIATLQRNVKVLQELVNGNAAISLPSGIYYIPFPVAEYIHGLSDDAMIMALRLYGEDPDSFGPECAEVMQRWLPEVEKVIGKEGIGIKIRLLFFRQLCVEFP